MGQSIVARRGAGNAGAYCYRRHQWAYTYGAESYRIVGGGYSAGGQTAAFSESLDSFGPILYAVNSGLKLYSRTIGARDYGSLHGASTRYMTVSTAAPLINKYCVFGNNNNCGLVTRAEAYRGSLEEQCKLYFTPISFTIVETRFIVTDKPEKQGFSVEFPYIYEEIRPDAEYVML